MSIVTIKSSAVKTESNTISNFIGDMFTNAYVAVDLAVTRYVADVKDVVACLPELRAQAVEKANARMVARMAARGITIVRS